MTSSASTYGCMKSATALVVPGTGIAIRAPGVTPRANTTVIRSLKSSSRSGNGVEDTRSSPKYCVISNTLRSDSTCDVTLRLERKSLRPSLARPRHVGTCAPPAERISSQFLISTVSCMSAANVPKIEALERFDGDWFHTGAWPQEGVDFAGKRVGLIGTGSTGIQATRVIAPKADHLTVFQLTANFSAPARHARLSPDRWSEIKANYNGIRELVRNSFAGFPYESNGRSALEFSEAGRLSIYEDLWEEGGFSFLWGSFSDFLRNKEASDAAAEFIRGKIREVVDDPEVAEKLLPTDHPYGSKRPPIDTGYCETYKFENVSLVDVRQSPIVEMTPTGLWTEEAEYELDVVVIATGFDAMTGSLMKMDIRGAGGQSLAEKRAERPRTYLGPQISGFLNLFTITGAGSPSLLTNMPVSIEQHIDWIANCIDHLRGSGIARIEAKPEAEAGCVAHVSELAGLTLFSQTSSWYLDANTPCKKRVFMPYVGGLASYRERCDEVADRGYEGIELRG